MIRAIIGVLIIITIYFLIVYMGFVKEPDEGVISHMYLSVKGYLDIPVNWIENFIEARRESLRTEIEKEKERVQEGVTETGRGIWERIGDFLFGS